MICLVSIEHESWLENPEERPTHLAYCMDVKLKVEGLTGQPCLVQRYGDATRRRLRDIGITALLISGNATEWSRYEPSALAELCDLIRAAEWPILGFCGGLQLIAMAHGAAVAPMARLRPGEPDVTTLYQPGYQKEWGFAPVSLIEADPIMDGLGPKPVFLEAHYCEVKELPAGFDLLATNDKCRIQMIKRVDRPVYGAQFHPESYTEGPHDRRNPLVNLVYPDGYPEARPDGRTLLSNFFRIARVGRSPRQAGDRKGTR
jgi:GMP synthase (glutamine-hydrolysing)